MTVPVNEAKKIKHLINTFELILKNNAVACGLLSFIPKYKSSSKISKISDAEIELRRFLITQLVSQNKVKGYFDINVRPYMSLFVMLLRNDNHLNFSKIYIPKSFLKLDGKKLFIRLPFLDRKKSNSYGTQCILSNKFTEPTLNDVSGVIFNKYNRTIEVCYSKTKNELEDKYMVDGKYINMFIDTLRRETNKN
jgi:hypothetical protein